jgi:hypothetical protein
MLRRFCRPRVRPVVPSPPLLLRPATQAAAIPSTASEYVSRPIPSGPLEPLQVPAPLSSANDKLGIYAQHSLYPSAVALEQVTLIDACLAQGYVERARGIFAHIEKNLVAHNGTADNPLRMCDIIAPRIHTEFFRSCFRSARQCEGPEEKEHAIGDVWDWLYKVLSDETQWGKLERKSWAVILKGLVS